MSKKGTIFFIIHAIIVALVALGFVPRVTILLWTPIMLLILGFLSLGDNILFFIQGIPLFIALPITAQFDSFNLWRIVSGFIIVRWFLLDVGFALFREGLLSFIRRPRAWISAHRVTTSLVTILILATLSLAVAQAPLAGLKRIVYFVNLSFFGIVLYDYLRRHKDFFVLTLRSIRIVTLIVVFVGLAQLASTYFMDIYQFMRIWGERINLNLFGTEWSYIATHFGNTWFAYFGDQLSLRMFSIFPDSHSFPVFVLLGLPAIYALAIQSGRKFSKQYILIPIIFLVLILSGTRGIWAGSLGAVITAFLAIKMLRGHPIEYRLMRNIGLSLILFFLCFTIAYPILASRQFRVPKEQSNLILKRIRSILDFGETSNSQRLEIWRKSIDSIIDRPLLGVGIYNYPVVLKENIALTRAGASAHNIYLHIAAELGLPALMLTLYYLWLFFGTIFLNIINSDEKMRAYFAAALIFNAWVFFYLLTDATLFDERAFLMFSIMHAIVFAYSHNYKNA